MEDKEKVFDHLVNLSKKYDGLTCGQCNVTKKYVKTFLAHIESCDTKVDVQAIADADVEIDKGFYFYKPIKIQNYKKMSNKRMIRVIL